MPILARIIDDTYREMLVCNFSYIIISKIILRISDLNIELATMLRPHKREYFQLNETIKM